MPFPVAHAITGASIIALSRRSVILSRDWISLLVGGLLATSPDFDFFLIWFLGFGTAWHRSFTHSILFALAVGYVTSGLAGTLRIREFLVYASVVISHLLLDFITTRTVAGVELLWPFSDHRFKLGLFNYIDANLHVNSLFDFAIGLFKISLIELLVLGPLFMLIIFIKKPR
jgi:membrane-bound metal-dependent hydrolase YbcI (DUF457 family)